MGAKNRRAHTARQKRRAQQREEALTRRKARDRILLATGAAAVVLGGVGIVLRGTGETGAAVRQAVEAAGGPSGEYTEDRDWRYTYVATDEQGIAIVAASGILHYRDGTCSNSGQVQVGTLPLNPGSAQTDVQTHIAAAGKSGGTGRIVTTREGERMILGDWSETTAMPLAWLEPLGKAEGLCDQLRATLDAVQGLKRHDGAGGEVERAIADDDTQTETVRLTGIWGGDGRTRPEIEVAGAGRFAIVTRKMENGTPSILAAALRLEDFEHDGEEQP